MDQNTEIVYKSWFSRIGGAFSGVLLGLALFLGAHGLLFWNEGRAVDREKVLLIGEELVQSVASDKIDPALNKKLIHIKGDTAIRDILEDRAFGVRIAAIHLKRRVMTFQWDEQVETETENQVGGGSRTKKTYSYEKVWSEEKIDSSEFHNPTYQNPTTWAYEAAHFSAKDVAIGAFELSPFWLRQLDHYQPLPLEGKEPPYIGKDPKNPQIGDQRIVFEIVRSGPLSIVGQQEGRGLEAYQTDYGPLALIEYGLYEAAEMFAMAREENFFMTWLLRLGGFLLMFFALYLMLKPISVLAGVIPFLESLLSVGLGVLAFLGALGMSLTNIACAWFYFRPLLSSVLIAVVVLLAVFIHSKRRSS